MNVIFGATGQIGSMLVDNLLSRGQKVRAVMRNDLQAQTFIDKGAEVAIADLFDEVALTKTMLGGDTVFLLTPENPKCEDFLKETQIIIKNYRKAVAYSKVPKVVGLSSMGAQHGFGMGNLTASYLLENAFLENEIEQIFVRPAYYFSNWLGYLEIVKEQGILPTFFPPDLQVPMVAPPDVADFLAKVMTSSDASRKTYEISSSRAYSSLDIAKTFETIVGAKIELQQILPIEWENTFLQAGFSKDGAKNFMLMTKSVIDGKVKPSEACQIHTATDFETYLENILRYR